MRSGRNQNTKTSNAVTVEYSTDWKTTFANLCSKWISSNPGISVNSSYPVMWMTSGTAATFTGIVNITATAMRFFVAYDNMVYSGTYSRSTSQVTTLSRITAAIE